MDSSIGVLLISTYFRPDVASTGMLVAYLAEDLAKLGHKVTVVTSFPHYDTNYIAKGYRQRLFKYEKIDPINVCRVYTYVPQNRGRLIERMLNYASFNIFSTLVGTWIGKLYDVILTVSPPLTNGLSASLISHVHHIPFIYNVQDIYPDIAIRMGVLTNQRIIELFRRIEQYIYRQAAALTVISEGFRRNLLAKGVPPDKIKVIPNFVDTEYIHPLPRYNKFSRKYGLDDKFVVLFAGNIGLSQGLETVIEAASKLKHHKDVLFLIVGDGASKPHLIAYTEKLSLQNVRFIPFQPHKIVPEMYASADVCLVPLRKGFTTESVPSKVFTIAAAGRPLIASVDRGSDTYHFVQQSKCGLWVEPENVEALVEAIMTFYTNRSLCELFGNNGRKYVETHYARQVITRRYAELLEEVAARR